jgi:hypothetical protein
MFTSYAQNINNLLTGIRRLVIVLYLYFFVQDEIYWGMKYAAV